MSVRPALKMQRTGLTVESVVLHHRISILKNRTGNDTAFGWLCHQASLTSHPVVSLTIMERVCNRIAIRNKILSWGGGVGRVEVEPLSDCQDHNGVTPNWSWLVILSPSQIDCPIEYNFNILTVVELIVFILNILHYFPEFNWTGDSRALKEI